MKNDLDDAQRILAAKYKMAMDIVNIIIKANQSWSADGISNTAWWVADKFHDELEKRSENIKLTFLENLDEKYPT
jgi:nicotinamide riboside kinase